MKNISFVTLLTILFLIMMISCNDQSNDSIINNTADSKEVEERIYQVTHNINLSINGVYRKYSLLEVMDFYNTPGVSIAIINNGEIEWARGFGYSNLEDKIPVDTATLFQAASVSKPIFALAVMRLYEKGIIDIDRDINDYLTDWKVPANGDWQPKISIRHLLSHSSGFLVHGFPGYSYKDTIPTLNQILNGQKPANTTPVKVHYLPGTILQYSSGGMVAAQKAITDKLDKPLPDIVDEELFLPLSLKYSTFIQPLPKQFEVMAATAYKGENQPYEGGWHIYPELAAAGLWTNPTELAKILIEIQNALNDDSDLITKETIELMLTPQNHDELMGLGFFLEGNGNTTRFEHSGWSEGFRCKFIGYKNEGKGLIVMTNSDEAFYVIESIIERVAFVYNWPSCINNITMQDDKNISDTNRVVDKNKISGLYKNDTDIRISIETINDNLYLKLENQNPFELIETKCKTFSNPHLGFEVSFLDKYLRLKQKGVISYYKKE